MFGRSNKVLISIIIVHVGDLLHCGSPGSFNAFVSIMKEFKHGEISVLSEKTGFTYCGVEIKLNPGREVELSQGTYAKTLQPMVKADYIVNNEMGVSSEKFAQAESVL